MSSFNKVILMGNLTRDPELRVLDSGSKVVNFGLAINEYYKDSDGEQQETVCFVDVESWNRQAEIVDQYLNKGSQVLIEGVLKYDTWQDSETGDNRSKLSVRAFNVRFIGGRNNNGDEDSYESTPSTGSTSTKSTNTPVEDDIPF